jgi:hypothetical protein
MSGRPLCRVPKSSPAPVQPEILLGDANSSSLPRGVASRPIPARLRRQFAPRENITADHILLGHGIAIAANRISKV